MTHSTTVINLHVAQLGADDIVLCEDKLSKVHK